MKVWFDMDTQKKSTLSKKKLTFASITAFSCPEDKAQAFLWDDSLKGLAVRATPPGKRNPKGSKAFIFQSTLDGKDIRITIGDVTVWDIDKARAEARTLQSKIDVGEDPRDKKRLEIKAKREQEESDNEQPTLKELLNEYLLKKRRLGGMHLKERTKSDYLVTMAESRPIVSGGGGKTMPGILYPLADRRINTISAKDIHKIYDDALKRGERQAMYAMQVLRALFNWAGIVIPGNPFSRETAGRDRITITQSKATGKPIPAERIGAWWNALERAANPISRDYFKFLMLSGTRVTEPKKILISDCDLVAGRIVLRDTKNRKDHVILLSRQLHEIVERNIKGKKPNEKLFDIVDTHKTMLTLIKRSGTEFRAKDLRSTFASIAEQLCSYATLKRLMNHAGGGDVTINNYIRIGDNQLRAGWQAVADFIDEMAKEESQTANVIKLQDARGTILSSNAA